MGGNRKLPNEALDGRVRAHPSQSGSVRWRLRAGDLASLAAQPLTGAHFRNWKEGSFQLPFFVDVGLRLFSFEDLAVGHRPHGALGMPLCLAPAD